MTKTVRLSDEAYERLVSWKKDENESFSHLILRKLPKWMSKEERMAMLERIQVTDEEAKAAGWD